MNLSVVGINYKTAPIDIREKFCLSDIEQQLLLKSIFSENQVFSILVLNTCNRVEIYVDSSNPHVQKVLMKTLFLIKKEKYFPYLKKHFYLKKNKSALDHIFKVASGLDSLVLGEQQILGQVKTAFQKSHDLGTLNSSFHLLKNILINSAKIVRSKTEIGFGGISVSWAATHFASSYFKGLKGKKCLLLGAGHMADLAAKNLQKKSLDCFFIMNRTKEKAMFLAQKFHAEACSFLDLKEILLQVDFCICAVDAPHYIIDEEIIEKIDKKKLLLIDISVPRNIDPRVKKYENIELLSIDELGTVLERGFERRKNAVQKAQCIIGEKVEGFLMKLKKMDDYRLKKEYSFSMNLESFSKNRETMLSVFGDKG